MDKDRDATPQMTANNPESVWPPPPERAGGEVAAKVEGTILVQSQDTLTVNLVAMRRVFLVAWIALFGEMVVVMGGGFFVVLQTRGLWIIDASVRRHMELFLVAALIAFVALFIFIALYLWEIYDSRMGRGYYIFDRGQRCLITGAHRRYSFECFRDVRIRWSLGCAVSLRSVEDQVGKNLIDRARNWMRRHRQGRLLGRYNKKSNAMIVANAVAEFMGLEVEGG